MYKSSEANRVERERQGDSFVLADFQMIPPKSAGAVHNRNIFLRGLGYKMSVW